MRPHSFESTLVQISVVDMLRSYHTALGVALYYRFLPHLLPYKKQDGQKY